MENQPFAPKLQNIKGICFAKSNLKKNGGDTEGSEEGNVQDQDFGITHCLEAGEETLEY